MRASWALLSNSPANARGTRRGDTPPRFPGGGTPRRRAAARSALPPLPALLQFWHHRNSEKEGAHRGVTFPTPVTSMVAIETSGWAPTGRSLSWYLGTWWHVLLLG